MTDDNASTSAADNLKAALARKRQAGGATPASASGDRASEREAAALSASRSKPAATNASKRG